MLLVQKKEKGINDNPRLMFLNATFYEFIKGRKLILSPTLPDRAVTILKQCIFDFFDFSLDNFFDGLDH